jgi:hypothetical protein
MTMFRKLCAALLLGLCAVAAQAGVKYNPCVAPPGLIDFKEYLVGGGAASPGNAFWAKANGLLCTIELWDLGLATAAAQGPNIVHEQVWSTTYAGGQIGLLAGAFPITHWDNVGGTGTTYFDADTSTLQVVMDLVGYSVQAPDLQIEVHLDVTYSTTRVGNECFVWAAAPGCTPHDFLGGTLADGGAATVNEIRAHVVPEPQALLLAGLALAALGAARRYRV